MSRRIVGRSARFTVLAGGLVLQGCTPVGAWVYDDPSFAIREVELRRAPGPGMGVDSLLLHFRSCNLNDFDLLGEGFEAQLVFAGHRVGAGRREQPYYLPNRDTSAVTLTLALDPDWLDRAPTGITRFEVLGNLLIKSPIGDRRIGLTQRGRVERDDTLLVIRSEEPHPCRPGLSRLPIEMAPRVPLAPPPQPPPGGLPPRGAP